MIRKKKQFLNRVKDKPWTLVGRWDLLTAIVLDLWIPISFVLGLSNVFSNPTMMTNILYTEKEIVDARDRGMADNFEIFYERLKLGTVDNKRSE